tara:strand:+ start:262 stop:720 length:459 start_codon:yes stop_codon:yes gene_type:complete
MKLKQLKKLGLPGKSHVTLSCSDGQDVFHYTDDDHEGKTVQETDIASKVATLISQKSFDNELITRMRSWSLLDEYEDRDGTFTEFLTDTIANNWRDCGLLDVLTEHYDHKRGFSRVTAEVDTTVEEVLNLDESVLSGWNLKVQLDDGSLEIE